MAEGVGTIDHAYISGPSHLHKNRDGNGNGNDDDEEHEFPTDIDEEEGSLPSSQPQRPQQGHEHGRGLEAPSTFDDEPRLARIESNASRPREATELGELRRRRSSDSTSEGSLSSNDYRATPRRIHSHTTTIRSADGTVIDGVTGRPKRFQAVRRFWLRNITLEVPHKANRDYFALERTFLAYMRTSATFSMQGIFIAQLFRLQSPTTQQPSSRINFYSVGIPLSIAYQTCAILIAILGAYRFWRQQHAIAAEKALIGSWELRIIGVLTLFAILVLLILALVIVAQS